MQHGRPDPVVPGDPPGGPAGDIPRAGGGGRGRVRRPDRPRDGDRAADGGRVEARVERRQIDPGEQREDDGHGGRVEGRQVGQGRQPAGGHHPVRGVGGHHPVGRQHRPEFPQRRRADRVDGRDDTRRGGHAADRVERVAGQDGGLGQLPPVDEPGGRVGQRPGQFVGRGDQVDDGGAVFHVPERGGEFGRVAGRGVGGAGGQEPAELPVGHQPGRRVGGPEGGFDRGVGLGHAGSGGRRGRVRRGIRRAAGGFPRPPAGAD